MLEIAANGFDVVAVLVGVVIGLQLVLAISVLVSLRAAARERQVINKELLGLVRRLEGLTSSRREQMLKHYDSILDTLSTKLPPAIAAQTGQIMFETESKILSRLAELEPNYKGDQASQQKMNDLIKSMESLEKTVVTLTADTVRDVMQEGRRSLADDRAAVELGIM